MAGWDDLKAFGYLFQLAAALLTDPRATSEGNPVLPACPQGPPHLRCPMKPGRFTGGKISGEAISWYVQKSAPRSGRDTFWMLALPLSREPGAVQPDERCPLTFSPMVKA